MHSYFRKWLWKKKELSENRLLLFFLKSLCEAWNRERIFSSERRQGKCIEYKHGKGVQGLV